MVIIVNVHRCLMCFGVSSDQPIHWALASPRLFSAAPSRDMRVLYCPLIGKVKGCSRRRAQHLVRLKGHFNLCTHVCLYKPCPILHRGTFAPPTHPSPHPSSFD
ncbi:hypothetical protein BHM03_00038827 [Ensete ventricosum]|nr:hypothetical protein BHM03_00038827 [Ensete ventricosum]